MTSTTSLNTLTAPAEHRVPLNATIRNSTLLRLDQLTKTVTKAAPSKNRSQVVDQLLSDKLDELGITLK
jgi:hypothetical protein